MAIFFARLDLTCWQLNLMWLDGLRHSRKGMWLIQEGVGERVRKIVGDGWIWDVAGELTW